MSQIRERAANAPVSPRAILERWYLDNCAVRTNEGLVAGGKSSLNWMFPGRMTRAAGALPGSQTFFIPQGSPIPQELLNLLPSFNASP